MTGRRFVLCLSAIPRVHERLRLMQFKMQYTSVVRPLFSVALYRGSENPVPARRSLPWTRV